MSHRDVTWVLAPAAQTRYEQDARRREWCFRRLHPVCELYEFFEKYMVSQGNYPIAEERARRNADAVEPGHNVLRIKILR